MVLLARQVGQYNQEPLIKAKRLLESRKSEVGAFGKYGSALMKQITGSTEDSVSFQKRYTSKDDGGNLDWAKVYIEDTGKIMESGKAELSKKIANIADDAEKMKGFITELGKAVGGTEAQKLQDEIEKAKNAGEEKNKKLMDVVGEIVSAYDAMVVDGQEQIDEKKKMQKDAFDTSTDLDKNYQQLLTQVNTTIDSMSGAITDLQKRQVQIDKKISSPFSFPFFSN